MMVFINVLNTGVHVVILSEIRIKFYGAFNIFCLYFKDFRAEEHYKRKGHKRTDNKDSPPKDDIPNKGRNLLLSGLIAFSAMFGYAIAAGLVQVDMGEAPAEEDDYEYEEYEEGSSGGD
ncbi:hypothetical protein SK128_000409 [Halocaridina rubra]|uniref:Uncharacterized protein n=1 Tax=Halocaridina rubra TaxID=373956 RepID=A0AAN8WDE9_HALRR